MPDHNIERHYGVMPVGERVSALEIRVEQLEVKMDLIVTKLDELLEMKHKGMGAIGLASLLVVGASGIAGVITFVLNLLSHR
jgi:hypothetical protein